MPELPEVEVCRRQLQRWSTGRRVVDVLLEDPAAVRHRRSTRTSDAHPDGAEALAWLVGREAGPLARRGKRLAWRFGDRGLLLHLGMTGKWVRRDAASGPRHGRLGLALDGGTVLWFVDPRRFGCVVPHAGEALEEALADGLGPDALEAPLDGDGLAARFDTRRAIKVALLDQDRIAGVGNIQAVEALWRARIHPETPARALSGAAWHRLAEALPEQLAHTVAITDAEEVAYMTDGHVDNPFEVYGRAGEACRRCASGLVSGRHGGRVTTWCPVCQPAPESMA